MVAATLEHVCAELEDAELLGGILSVKVDPDWPPGEYDHQAQEFFRDRLREGGKDVIGWYVWYIILRNDPRSGSVLVGSAGFFGPPNDRGEVEIGISILPAWEGRGFATEIVRMLVLHAFTDTRVLKIIAHTAPQNMASQRVLEKSGFRLMDKRTEDGRLRFEISGISPAS